MIAMCTLCLRSAAEASRVQSSCAGLFESEQQVDVDALMDAFRHGGLLVASPWATMLLQAGYMVHPRCAKRNFERLRSSWKGKPKRHLPPLPPVCHLCNCTYTKRSRAARICCCCRCNAVCSRPVVTALNRCAAILNEILERDVPDTSAAFWACLRRAFPDAKHDGVQYEKCLANVGLVYGAGSETTAAAAALTLAALAADPESMAALEQARCRRL
jgi:hypothetical protein